MHSVPSPFATPKRNAAAARMLHVILSATLWIRPGIRASQAPRSKSGPLSVIGELELVCAATDTVRQVPQGIRRPGTAVAIGGSEGATGPKIQRWY
jgi:hypothetical protein